MSAKRLIVNADDLGRTPGINAGIERAHRDGIVTSASVMVCFPSAQDVPDLARRNPDLGLGLHLAFTGSPPALTPGEIPSLTDMNGRLPDKPEGLGGARPNHVLAEGRAQLRRFRGLLGREPTHLDTHHHSHDVPVVFEALTQLAWEGGIPVRSTSTSMRERLRAEGIATPDAFLDSFFGPGASLDNLLRLLRDLEPGVTELMCHPALVDDELSRTSSYSSPRALELVVLTHLEARAALQALGVRLVHFGSL